MDKKNFETLSEIGTQYMSGMSERVRMHFETTCLDRLTQVEVMVNTISEEDFTDMVGLKEELEYIASARGFDHLAFFSNEGIFESDCGAAGEAARSEDRWHYKQGTGRKDMGIGRAHV